MGRAGAFPRLGVRDGHGRARTDTDGHYGEKDSWESLSAGSHPRPLSRERARDERKVVLALSSISHSSPGRGGIQQARLREEIDQEAEVGGDRQDDENGNDDQDITKGNDGRAAHWAAPAAVAAVATAASKASASARR
jgi:hypothetical protein